jgi:ribonucleotide reductase alpha subunit
VERIKPRASDCRCYVTIDIIPKRKEQRLTTAETEQQQKQYNSQTTATAPTASSVTTETTE